MDLIDLDAETRGLNRADLQRLAADREAYRTQVVLARPRAGMPSQRSAGRSSDGGNRDKAQTT